ncbi:putative DMT superfamily transporter inner membrane protein [Serratia fonticola]|uniref:DMT family transporter n=2 Tax=Serratia TaxID=613 RepID=A0AAW3WVB3_SERFO|nr:DMT family transporter [Serratia fonticola]NYA14960.1 DMT family transporter [Serratia fonticola]NYA34982.1 DMT family transporter [Serratia fonticola]NYA45917.1 DMT family transporter [Serratia fonticola]CAI0729910.1 putative DMT superfamily transporter inner membrane protein [Serratia fonticola]
MMLTKNAWASYGTTMLFVLLWGSGAIFSRWGLDHSSAFAILTLRFILALSLLVVIASFSGGLLPKSGTRGKVALTGVLLIGGYSICYFLALEHGVTPGVLATILGAQPILTLVLTERNFSLARLGGLVLALCGLTLVVFEGLSFARMSVLGLAFALLALVSMTTGALLQKTVQQSPQEVMPLQYLVSLVFCLCFVPFKPFEVDWGVGFLLPLLWLGLVISVGAQFLLYRLIRSGNMVNVTSLFYLVPVVTAVMDYLFLGNVLPALSLLGMAAILLGLVLVFRVGQRKTNNSENK